MDNKIVGTLTKNSRERLCVSLGEFKGHPYVDIRLFDTMDPDKSVPTKKGLAVHPRLIPELISLLEKARQQSPTGAPLGPKSPDPRNEGDNIVGSSGAEKTLNTFSETVWP